MQGDCEMGKVIVIGSFQPRTRFQAAHDECLAMLQLLGFGLDVIQEVMSGRAAVKVMWIRLISWHVAGDIVQASRDRPVVSALCDGTVWMARARSPAEAARIAPIARGVRSLKQLRDSRRTEGSADQWDVEGSNRPGEEGISLSTDDWKSEHMIVWRNLDTGAWTMSADAVQTLCMDVNPHEWLVSLL